MCVGSKRKYLPTPMHILSGIPLTYTVPSIPTTYTVFPGIALKMSQNYFAKISKLHYLIIIFAYYNANLAYFRQTYISQ
jgi:hypothetical protein